jgi:tellurite methyltransferase
MSMSSLPRKARLLDPRSANESAERPIVGAVNIPLAELPDRTHELPSKGETILVAGVAGATEAVAWLEAHGRTAVEDSDFEYGLSPAGRLWEPNAFLLSVLPSLEPGTALDLGCGSGRDAVAMASFGWRVIAVDHLPDALEMGRDLERRYLGEHPPIDWRAMDLEKSLPDFGQRFDLITSFFYLNRPMLDRLADYLNPGGHVVLETFTTVHREARGKPRREHLAIVPGELRHVPGIETLRLEENWHGGRHTARWFGEALSIEH